MTGPGVTDWPPLKALPGLPQDADSAVFAAPWEAKAFALVVNLHQRGAFAWSDWVQTLAAEIRADREQGADTPYYRLWLAAAEHLVAAQGLVPADQLEAARAALVAAQDGVTAPDREHASHGHDHDHDHDH